MFLLLLVSLLHLCQVGLMAQLPDEVPIGHAHNDYTAKKPLLTALEARMKSIEVDVHLAGGMLYVAHHRPFRRTPDRQLDAMYLRPLFDHVEAHHGCVYSDEPLLLMIDFKGDGAVSYKLLKEYLLPFRHHLSRVEGGLYIEGAVQVFVSGNRPFDALLAEDDGYVFLDGRPGEIGKGIPATRMPVLSFRAAAELPKPLRKRNRDALAAVLQTWSDQCAKEGKLLRVWGAPDKPWFWELLLGAGIRLVNTDRPAELRTFVTSRSSSTY